LLIQQAPVVEGRPGDWVERAMHYRAQIRHHDFARKSPTLGQTLEERKTTMTVIRIDPKPRRDINLKSRLVGQLKATRYALWLRRWRRHTQNRPSISLNAWGNPSKGFW
jgi:hypothetical protein